MTSLSLDDQLPKRPFIIAAVSLVLLVTAAFLAAQLTQNQDLFSLIPEAATAPDIAEAERLNFHLTFFTAWTSLILTIPALCTVWFRRGSKVAAAYWIAFWTAGFIAYLLHFYWAVVIIFGGDWQSVMNSPRVSAPVLDMVLTVWWGIDVVLAWLIWSKLILSEVQPGQIAKLLGRLVAIQSILIHLLTLVVFIAASLLEGELLLSRLLGVVMAIPVIISLVIWFRRWSKGRQMATSQEGGI